MTEKREQRLLVDEQNGPPDSQYSRAYEGFVEEPDDIIGLLAYALYKRGINERRASGYAVLSGGQRNPHRHEIETYRSQSENYLRIFVQSAIEEETPNILRQGVKSEVGRIESSLNGWRPFGIAILTGIIAWFFSLVITIIIALTLPDWVNNLVSHIKGH